MFIPTYGNEAEYEPDAAEDRVLLDVVLNGGVEDGDQQSDGEHQSQHHERQHAPAIPLQN